MSTENISDQDPNDSDDGFEVLDPEPKNDDETEDFKYLSRKDFTNAGTIIFCHIEDEYNSIQRVRCEYIRPERWVEQEKDEIAIFEVGWITVEEAVAKIPVDLTIPSGYPLGSLSLSEFSFRNEDYAEVPGAVSYFQFVYLREGNLLGASTPFGIRGIKAVGRMSLIGEKPLDLAMRPEQTNALYQTRQLDTTANSFSSLFDSSLVDVPSYKHDHHYYAKTEESVDERSEGAISVELSALRNTIRNLTASTRRLQTRKERPSAQLVLELKESVDELTAEMQKVAEGLLPGPMVPAASESCEDLEQRYRTCAAQLKANLQGCTRTFDVCKVAVTNQTPPSSLSEFPRTDSVQQSVWREEESQMKKQLEEAEEEIKILREELSTKVSDLNGVKQELENKGAELETVKQELSVKETDHDQVKKMLEKTEAELKAVKEELSSKEASNRDLVRQALDAAAMLELVKTELSVKETDHALLKKELGVSESDLKVVKQAWASSETRFQTCSAEASKLRAENRGLEQESSALKMQIQSLLNEEKEYKAGKSTLVGEVMDSRNEAKRTVEELTVLKLDNKRLVEIINELKAELANKNGGSSNCSDPHHDILVQEFLQKSEEVAVAKRQVENFKEELSRLNGQRTKLLEEVAEARQKTTTCERPCCTFEITPGKDQPNSVVDSILDSLDQALKENKNREIELEKAKTNLEMEKKRAEALEEKLQIAAGQCRSLFMEKLGLEKELKNLLRSE